MRRQVALATILTLVLFGFSLETSSGAKKYEGQTMSIYAGISPLVREDIMAHIAPKLKEEYGLTLSVEVLGSAPMLQKVVVMRDNPTVTIANWDEPIGIQACEMGLCAPIDVAQAKTLSELNPWALVKVDDKVRVVATTVVGIGLIYNSDEFARKNLKPPSSWNDLWRPELSKRISVTAPESTWGLGFLVMLARLNGGGESNIDPAFAKLKTLLPHVQTIHSWSSDLAKLMQLGQVWESTTGSNMGPALKAQGFPATWVAPTEGAPMVNGGISIVANAPFQDAAHTFLNIYFGPEFQALRAKNGGLVPAHSGAWKLLTTQEAQALPIGPDDISKLQRLDWVTINQHRAAWVERWHKEIQQ
jgi:putative spermidine/putrescine transport system substrate-binding protein